MNLNPTVQVAALSVLTTIISTIGVIRVSIIENRKQGDQTRKIIESGGISGYEDKNLEEILESLLEFIEENERKESKILNLRKRVRALTKDINYLQLQLKELYAKQEESDADEPSL
jgi:peptidoglycan hydrolase CwlO-like protein